LEGRGLAGDQAGSQTLKRKKRDAQEKKEVAAWDASEREFLSRGIQGKNTGEERKGFFCVGGGEYFWELNCKGENSTEGNKMGRGTLLQTRIFLSKRLPQGGFRVKNLYKEKGDLPRTGRRRPKKLESQRRTTSLGKSKMGLGCSNKKKVAGAKKRNLPRITPPSVVQGAPSSSEDRPRLEGESIQEPFFVRGEGEPRQKNLSLKSQRQGRAGKDMKRGTSSHREPLFEKESAV